MIGKVLRFWLGFHTFGHPKDAAHESQRHMHETHTESNSLTRLSVLSLTSGL
jgi:hypothetical protein